MKYRYVYIALIGLALIVFQFLLQPEWQLKASMIEIPIILVLGIVILDKVWTKKWGIWQLDQNPL